VKRSGGYTKLRNGNPDLFKLSDKWIQYATKHGYVETLPDRVISPNRGYPMLCTRTEYSEILPTVPFSYHVQGTAGWIMARAEVECEAYLDKLRESNGFTGFITMDVHDEMVFDFPKRGDPLKDPDNSNLGIICVIKDLMEDRGMDLIPSIPTTVKVEYHPDNWSEGITVPC
jgi:hypothetical protein